MSLRKDALRVSREKQEPGVTELLRAAILSDDGPGLIEKIGGTSRRPPSCNS